MAKKKRKRRQRRDDYGYPMSKTIGITTAVVGAGIVDHLGSGMTGTLGTVTRGTGTMMALGAFGMAAPGPRRRKRR